MLFYLIFLFTVVPIIELYVLIQAGQVIGGANTIAIVLFTGILGAVLAKSQGRRIWTKIQKDIEQGRVPTKDLVHGLLVFIGGLFLVTPGFITDFFGFCMVLPFTRLAFVEGVLRYFEQQIRHGNVKVYSNSSPFSGSSKASRSPRSEREVIDVQAEESQTDYESKD